MAIIKFRRRNTGAVGAPASLLTGEPAFNDLDNTLYYGRGNDGSGNATSVIAIGGPGAFVDLASAQTISGIKTFSNAPLVPTQTLTDNSTKASSTAFVQGQFPSVTGTTATKITFNNKGLITASAALVAGDIPNITPSQVTGFDTQVRTSRLDQMAVPTSTVFFGGQLQSNVADPISPQDSATKNYVDTVATGLDAKASVRAATTGANITLSGTQTIDGVSLAVNDRVLVKDQTTASTNGIYLVSASTWTRTTDFDSWTEIPGAFTFVEEGTLNGDTGWVCSSNAGGTLNTTAITFVQFSSAGVVLAGNGLNKTGNTLSVVGTANRITVSGSGVDIASNYVGQNTITTLGTVTTGTWNGTLVGLAYGGTGSNTTVLTDGALLKKVGTAFVAAVVDTDYLAQTSTVDGGTF